MKRQMTDEERAVQTVRYTLRNAINAAARIGLRIEAPPLHSTGLEPLYWLGCSECAHIEPMAASVEAYTCDRCQLNAMTDEKGEAREPRRAP